MNSLIESISRYPIIIGSSVFTLSITPSPGITEDLEFAYLCLKIVGALLGAVLALLGIIGWFMKLAKSRKEKRASDEIHY